MFRRYGVRDLKIIDPVFNMPGTHYKDILRFLLDLGYRGQLAMECRFEFVDEEFVDLCTPLGACPEFGLQTTVPEEEVAINRQNNTAKIRAAARLLQRHRVPFLVSLMYGVPLQTPASFQRSMDFAESLGPSRIEAYPLGLYRGTRLEQEREKWGFKVANGGLPLIVATSSSTRKDVELMKAMVSARGNK